MTHINNRQHNEFYVLVEPNMRSLKNTAYRLTKDELDSEDLLQETLYKAYKAFGQYEVDTNFRAWVFRIMVNTFISSYRKRIRQPQKVSYEGSEAFYIYQNSDSGSLSSESYDSKSTEDYFNDDIKEALDKLPYYFRLFVLLYDIEGFSYLEISNMVGIPVGTVMSRLHRGRSLLRTKLHKYAKKMGFPVAQIPITN
jgi:RNA polymerase sigma-70 factor (ECF subfamily)